MNIKELLLKNKKSFTIYMLGALLTTLGSPFFNLSISYAFGILEAQTTSRIIWIAVGALVLSLIPVLFQFISRLMRIGFMRDTLIDVRMLAYDKIMHLSGESFRKESKDFYMSRLVGDINLFERDFFVALLNIVFMIGSFIINSLLLIYLAWEMVIIAWVCALLLFAVTKFFEKRVRKARKATQAANDAFYKEISNGISGGETIKLYQTEASFLENFKSSIHELESVKGHLSFLTNTESSISQGLNYIVTMSVYFLAAFFITKGRLSMGELVLVTNVVGAMSWGLISGFYQLNRFKSSVDIFNGLVQYDALEREGSDFVFEEQIVAKKVSYAYDGVDVISDVNLKIDQGDKVLIHGKSGSGKTTFVNCLSHNLSGFEGLVSYDGVSLESVSNTSYLGAVGYVRQSHFMFEDTIQNNIILNQPYDQAKFDQVLQDASLKSWIDSEKDGKEMMVLGNGGNISGGQMQRISIARELYRDCDVLFVDEPSASLDDENASVIYDTLLKLDKTVICVSHRHLDYLKDKFTQVVDMEEYKHVG